MNIRSLKEKDKYHVEEIFDLYWKDSFRKNLQDKLDAYFMNSHFIKDQDFHFYVCELDKKIIGVAAYRKASEYMMKFTGTPKPAEFYMSAVKEKRKGIGTLLRDFRVNKTRENGYTEIVFFGGENHRESWDFHDSSGFTRFTGVKAPNGEKGYIWRMVLV